LNAFFGRMVSVCMCMQTTYENGNSLTWEVLLLFVCNTTNCTSTMMFWWRNENCNFRFLVKRHWNEIWFHFGMNRTKIKGIYRLFCHSQSCTRFILDLNFHIILFFCVHNMCHKSIKIEQIIYLFLVELIDGEKGEWVCLKINLKHDCK
jgi:hypothetical protein